ncbi:MAG: TRAPP subunit trs31 [Icmadophila ericetorum]|nr:TRAPP subunit trs31 [Icmadophila ericetorum]
MSTPQGSSRQSISNASQQLSTTSTSRPLSTSGLRTPLNRRTIYDRNLNRTRTAELSRASFAYLFSEMVGYAQKRVTGIQDLERRLNEQGYPLGLRLLPLLTTREPPRTSHRLTRILPLLQFITTTLWRHLFSRPADALERSSTNEDEYMISDNDPLVNQYISVPKEMNQLNCAAFVAGIIEGVCDASGLGVVSVSAHNGGTEMWPGRTVFLIRFEEGVREREGLVERDGRKG